jgi:hypothetical protein
MLGGQLAVDPCRDVSEPKAGRSGLNIEGVDCSYRFVAIGYEEVHLKLMRQAKAGREGRQEDVLAHALRRNIAYNQYRSKANPLMETWSEEALK